MMEVRKSQVGHNLRLLQVTVESALQPIARDATLRLRTQSTPTSSHFMEIHIDGRIMAQWNLDVLATQLSKAARELSCKFRSSAKDKVLQLMLPLPASSETEITPSSSSPSVQTYPSNCLKIIRLHLDTHQDFHTAVAYLSKEAGLFHKDMPESAHRDSSFPRALSAMGMYRGTTDSMTPIYPRSQEQLLHFAQDADRLSRSISEQERRMLPPNGATSRPSSAMGGAADFNPVHGTVSRRQSNYEPHVSSYGQQSRSTATHNSFLQRRYSGIGRHITRPSTALPYSCVSERLNVDAVHFRNRVPGHQFFGLSTAGLSERGENASTPQTSQDRPLLGTLDPYQSKNFSHGQSRETDVLAQIFNETGHDSAISGISSSQNDQPKVGDPDRMMMRDVFSAPENFGWAAAADSQSACREPEPPAILSRAWGSIATSRSKARESPRKEVEGLANSAETLDISGECPPLFQRSSRHKESPAVSQRSPGILPSIFHKPESPPIAVSISDQNTTDVNSESWDACGDKDLEKSGFTTGKDGSEPLEEAEVITITTKGTRKRPAASHARPQSRAKKPRKSHQVGPMRRPKSVRSSTQETSRAAPTNTAQAVSVSQTLSKGQISSTVNFVTAATGIVTQGQEDGEQKASELVQPEFDAGLHLDTRGAAQGGPQPQMETKYTENKSRLGGASTCTRCRRKKQKCGGLRPTCAPCAKSGVSACVYPNESYKSGQEQHPSPDDSNTANSIGGVELQVKDGKNAQAHMQYTKSRGGAGESAPRIATTMDSGLSTCSTIANVNVQIDDHKRLHLGLLEWRRLIHSGMALEANHLQAAIDILKIDFGSSQDHESKLVRAAQHGGQFLQALLELFRGQVTIS
ncbi:hypothetical protein BD289DRAFT_192293 [Coniella lustricola]|uniref:Zn(2)-C6 fungal-type domain-containing protein n=1 Tax=Coniella lustricola TaxID=2025994 RepID=A0A2T3ALW0_9PEZI|nr:hypothetical protein BD289DRAFT_192293 [Coniella lustricola]